MSKDLALEEDQIFSSQRLKIEGNLTNIHKEFPSKPVQMASGAIPSACVPGVSQTMYN
jgi:hypothetical protein